MSKIVDFNPSKRDTLKKFQLMKEMLETADPETISEMIVYIKTEGDKKNDIVWAYGPSWQMIGQLSVFREELKLELYAEDFIDSEEEDELQ